MKRYNYNLLTQSISRMPHWQATALCVASAEKVTPIIREIGLPSTWMVVQECLKHAWLSLETSQDCDVGQELIKTLHSTPEWECDDSSHLAFIVTKALDFVNFALLASNDASIARDQAERAFSLLLEVTENFDTAASHFPASQLITDMKLQLLIREQISQQQLVTLLDGITEVTPEVVKKLRDEAFTISDSLNKLLPIYAYYYLRG